MTFLVAFIFSSQHANPFVVLKHHLRLMYKKNTRTSAIKPKAAARNVVVSIGTVMKSGWKKKKNQLV
jgi:hypothetical protein